MKTIATVAVLMMLTASALADESERMQAIDPMNSNEPVLLSEAEMDRVTASGKHRHVFGIESTQFNAESLPQERFIFNYDYFNTTPLATN